MDVDMTFKGCFKGPFNFLKPQGPCVAWHGAPWRNYITKQALLRNCSKGVYSGLCVFLWKPQVTTNTKRSGRLPSICICI